MPIIQGYKPTFMPEIVKTLREFGGRCASIDVYHSVVTRLKIPSDVLEELMPSGQRRVYKEISYCRQYLVEAGILLPSSETGIWELSGRGWTIEMDNLVHEVRGKVDGFYHQKKANMKRSYGHGIKRINGSLINESSYQDTESVNHAGPDQPLRQPFEGTPRMQEKIITVTPAVAAEFLQKNFLNNRNMRQPDIDRMALEMVSRTWREDVMGSFGFHQDGTLRNGQHRCAAIVKSGTTWRVRVLYNLTDEDCRVLDLGRTRTYPDTLKLDGVESSGKLGPAIRFLWNYEHNYRHGGRAERNPGIPAQNSVREKSPGLQASLPYGNRCWKYISPSVGSGLHYLFTQINCDRADAFFTSIADGDGLPKGAPVLRLRDAIHARLKQVKRIFPAEQTHLVIQAWNAYIMNRKSGVLTYHVGEPTPPIASGRA